MTLGDTRGLLMDPDRRKGRRTDGHEGPDEQRWTLRRILVLCAAFGTPIVLLVFAGSLLVVPLIYLVLSAEGVFVALLAISETRTAGAGRIAADGGGKASSGGPRRSGDRVETLTSYVKWAAKGSDFSRRDIARTVMRIAEQSHVASPDVAGHVGSPEKDLSEAIETLVYPYRDDSFIRSGISALRADGIYPRDAGASPGEAGTTPAKAGPAGGRPGRARYLASLEEVVTRLEQGMDRSGSV